MVANKSTSCCTTESAHGMHVFHVHQYSLLKALPLGRSVRSATFSIEGYDWAISFYPSGAVASPPHQQHAAVALDLLAVPPSTTLPSMARAVFGLGFVDQQTTGAITRSVLPGGRKMTFLMFSSKSTQTNPLYCFHVDRNVLEVPPYLVDDRLAIGCYIYVIKDSVVSASQPVPHVAPPPPGLSNDLGELMEKGPAADVTFHVGGEAFAVHRAVLAARSPVFKAELLGVPMKENASGHVNIKDTQPAVFKAMLAFVCTDELPSKDDNILVDKENDDDYTTEMHRHLLVAADRYGIPRLKQVCETVLCRSLNGSTFPRTRALAEQHGCDRLNKKACEQFLISSRSRALHLQRPHLRVMLATTSSCTPKTAHGVHVFHVHQSSSLQFLGVGRFVRSGTFTVGSCDWALRLYPSGGDHVAVWVELLGSTNAGEAVTTELGVRLVDVATGQTRSLLPEAKAKQSHTFDNNNVFTLDIDKKEFEAEPYLHDGRVTIECEVTTIEVPPRVPESRPLPDFGAVVELTLRPPGLASDLISEMLKTDSYLAADVTFHGGGFSAHKELLVARSPVSLVDATALIPRMHVGTLNLWQQM